MAPRPRKVVPPTSAEPTVSPTGAEPTVPIPPIDSAPAQQPRARTQAVPPPEEQGEYFDLNVAGSDDDEEPARTQDAAAQEADSDAESDVDDINDPTISKSTTGAADIKHFFKKSKGHRVCRPCRQVLALLRVWTSDLRTRCTQENREKGPI
jgi:hypothetical protein